MDKPNLIELGKKAPLLATYLAVFHKNDLPLKVYSPTDTGPQVDIFHEYCKKLNINNDSYLVVVPDGKLIWGGQGMYSEICGAVFLEQSIFDKLESNPRSQYITAHEIGHKKDAQTRRHWLKTAGSFVVGLGVGYSAGRGTASLLDQINPPPDDTKKANRLHLMAAAPVAYFSGMLTFIHLQQMLMRVKEFAADDQTEKVLGTKATIQGIFANVAKKLGSETLESARREFDQSLQQLESPISPENADLMFMLAMAERTIVPLDITGRIIGQRYPSDYDRIARRINTTESGLFPST
jgi:hypothetical protein